MDTRRWFRLDRHADPLAPGSPLWWVDRLRSKLRTQRADAQVFDDYYEGKHPLAFASEKFLTLFGPYFEEFADNWMPIVADALVERLGVVGFRFGGDGEGDRDAWRIWQANNLDSEHNIALTEAAIAAQSFLLVWRDPSDEATPMITVESAHEVVVAYDSGNRRRRAAALKVWTGDDGHEHATLYLPDRVHKFRQQSSAERRVVMPNGVAYPGGWVPREDDGPAEFANPLGVVPVVPLCNRPRLLKPARSELQTVIPMQNAVNKLVADMMAASELGAMPARWATGYEVEVDDNGRAIPPPITEMWRRMLINENPGGKFGQFTPAQLGDFRQSIEMLIQHIASQTRTPPHYFMHGDTPPSGESIKSAETGLVAKARNRQLTFGEAFEEAMRLAFAVLDDDRADALGAETLWRDPESRTEGEHVDAVLKTKALGIPWRQLMIDLGKTPQEIDRMEQWRREDARLAAQGFDPFAAFDELMGADEPDAVPTV